MKPPFYILLECVVILGSSLIGYGNCETKDVDLPTLSRKVRYVLFPDSTNMGLLLAVAIPLENANFDVSLAWNIEADYRVPDNFTELALPFVAAGLARTERDITRRRTYETLEQRFERYGLEGRECLLRTICETAETPLHHNGLMGDILHVLFTPSTSADEKLDSDFNDAEEYGKNGQDCRSLYPKCPLGLFDFISELEFVN